jgi:hypothetical protein
MRSLIPALPGGRLVAIAAALGGAIAVVPGLGAGADLPNAQNVKVYDFSPGAKTPAVRGGANPILAPRFAQRVTVRGRLGFFPSGRGLNGAVVQVVSPTNQVAAAALTNRAGRFVVRWSAQEIGAFRVTAVGVPQIQQTVMINLRPRVVVTDRRRAARPGDVLLIRGGLRPSFSGSFIGSTRLQVQQAPSGGWRTVSNSPLGADARFALRYVVPRGGARNLRMRVITPASPTGWASGVSREISLRVR